MTKHTPGSGSKSTPGSGSHNTPDVGSTTVATDTAEHRRSDPDTRSVKQDLLGDDRPGSTRNISWGAVIAGVVTFLALTLLLSLVTAALGLGMADLDSENPGEGVGLATGLWSIVTLVLAMAAGGYVAGVLAGKAGLIHGFLTWATALLAAVVLASLLVGNILGAAGSLLGSTASAVTDTVSQNPEQAAGAVPDVEPSEAAAAADDAQEQAGDAVQDAAPEAEQAAETASSGALWTFVGLLVAAVIAAGAGLLGSRSVENVRDSRQGRTTRA